MTGDIYATVEKAVSNCVDFGAYEFTYDADGMGAGARGDARKINESREDAGLSRIEAKQFHGSGSVISKDKWFH